MNRKKLVRTASLISLRIVAALSSLIFTVYITRTLPPGQASVFFICFSIVVLLSAVCRQGFDIIIIKKLAIYRQNSNSEESTKFYKHVVIRTALAIFLVLVVLYTAQTTLNAVDASPSIVIATLSLLPLYCFTALHGFCFQGIGLWWAAIIFRQIAFSILTLLFCLLYGSDSLLEVLYCALAGSAFSLFLAVLLWHKKNKVRTETTTNNIVVKHSIKYFFFIVFFNHTTQWISPILLGILGEVQNVALYTAASRLAMVLAFVYTAFNYLISHKFAALYAQGKIAEIKITIRSAVRISFAVSVPVFLFFIFFGERVLSLFGEGYEKAWFALLILSFGQLVNAITGPAALLQQMSGNENRHFYNLFVSTSLLLVLSIVLIPAVGWIGASLATASAVITQNVLGVIQVRRTLGINIIKEAYRK